VDECKPLPDTISSVSATSTADDILKRMSARVLHWDPEIGAYTRSLQSST